MTIKEPPTSMQARPTTKTIVLVSVMHFLFFSFQGVTQESGCLWSIGKSEEQLSGFIYGTMHIIPKDEFDPPEMMDSLISTCDKVVTEIALDLYIEEQFDLASAMVLGKNITLADFIDSSQMAGLNRLFIDTLNISESLLQNQYYNLKPVFISTMVLKDLVGPAIAADQWVGDLAKKHGIELGSLESIYDQIGFIDSIPMKTQLEWLLELNSDMEKEYRNMLRIYQKGDLDSLLLISQMDPNSKADSELRAMRNRNWIDRIENHLTEGKTLFAVGALHLPGTDGVLELLKAQGFEVRVVRTEK